MDDLAALIEQLGLGPAWVAGGSSGAAMTLKLAATRPEILGGIVMPEPPLFGLLEEGSAQAREVAEIEAARSPRSVDASPPATTPGRPSSSSNRWRSERAAGPRCRRPRAPR